MTVWNVYEKITPIIGEPYEEFVGTVEARTNTSALKKAAKKFKVQIGGYPVRRRKAENFIVRAPWKY